MHLLVVIYKMITKYPKAVVFDLDYTLWPCWCDTHISTPIKSISPTEIIDAGGMRLSFYPDVESIILELYQANVKIIAASRTGTPHIAKDILTKLHIAGKPALTYFDSLQFGQGSKIGHIRSAAKELKLIKELQQGEFILYDDERRNRDVIKINCHFAHIEDEIIGITRDIFITEINIWAKRKT